MLPRRTSLRMHLMRDSRKLSSTASLSVLRMNGQSFKELPQASWLIVAQMYPSPEVCNYLPVSAFLYSITLGHAPGCQIITAGVVVGSLEPEVTCRYSPCLCPPPFWTDHNLNRDYLPTQSHCSATIDVWRKKVILNLASFSWLARCSIRHQ